MVRNRRVTLRSAGRTTIRGRLSELEVGGKYSKKHKGEEKHTELGLKKKYAYQYRSAFPLLRYSWYADVWLDEATYSMDESGNPDYDRPITMDTVFLDFCTREELRKRALSGEYDARISEVLGHHNWQFRGIWRLKSGEAPKGRHGRRKAS